MYSLISSHTWHFSHMYISVDLTLKFPRFSCAGGCNTGGEGKRLFLVHQDVSNRTSFLLICKRFMLTYKSLVLSLGDFGLQRPLGNKRR